MRPPSETLQAAYDFCHPNRYGLKRYLLKDGAKHPFAVILPGGAYRMVCSFVEGMPFAKALNAKGYHAIVVYYRVNRKAQYPAPQEDLDMAIREIFANAEAWGLDTENWSLWGSSAGGHLAAGFCTEPRGVPKPNALILTYPVITMGEKTHAVSRKMLLGEAPSEEMILRTSVERHIPKDYPPTYVWNGTADTSVDPENARMLERALCDAGVPCRHDEFEGIGHGVGLAEGTNAEPWFANAVSFWKEQNGKRSV